MRKKVLLRTFYAICGACLVWLGASFINVNAHNLNDHSYAGWNVFCLMADAKAADVQQGETELVTVPEQITDSAAQITDSAADVQRGEWVSTMQEQITDSAAQIDDSAADVQRGEWVSTMQEQRAEQLEADAQAGKTAKKAAKEVAKEAAKEGKFQEQIFQLAQIMMAENGQNEEAAILTGVVVLKRVKSEYFPDSIANVIAEPGQYDSYRNGSALTIEPNEMCMECAEELLRFDLADDYPDNLLFQAEFVQGSGVYRQIGNQYFCLM